MRSPRVPTLAAAATIALAGCGSGDGGQATDGGDTATRTTAAAGGCRKVPAPPPKRAPDLPQPSLRLDPDRTYRAVVDTNCGSFTITLDVRRSPRTSASFVHLARAGFYNGLTFHRVISGFVIQGGDPAGNGTGGPGYQVVEPPPAGMRYTRGVVAMAKTEAEDPGTSGSQFYVVTGEDAQLPPDYAVLGRVTAGQDVVGAIEIVPTEQQPRDPSRQDRPLSPVVIRSVTIRES
jgi:cyclophilin family peptidyl-prolyl cis-trans isomerase